MLMVILILDFQLNFPNGHAPTFKAISCQENRGSFDPNNKIAQPAGYNAEHYINPKQYIDYQINFQNTGNRYRLFCHFWSIPYLHT